MTIEELHPAQSILGALEEEQRHVHIGEVGDSKPVWLAGRMQRIGVEDHPLRRITLGHEVGRHPAPHRPPGEEQPVDPRPEKVGGATVTSNQLRSAVRAPRAPLGIGVVEREHSQAGRPETVAEPDHVGVVLVNARPVRQEQADPPVSDEATSDFTLLPLDRYGLGHGANLDHRYRCPSMRIFVHDDSAEVARAVADRVTGVIDAAAASVNIGLAGGSTPAAAYELLRSESGWEKVDAWLSDERWVGPDHERCNGAQAASLLMDHVPARFHRPKWGDDLTPDESAADYERTLTEIYDGRRPDLILLGMGGDGHVASLFPETGAIDETERLYVANHVPQLDEDRLTATYPLLWMARLLVVMVTGPSKAPALADCLQGDRPGGMLGDGDAEVEWHVDREAASLV